MAYGDQPSWHYGYQYSDNTTEGGNYYVPITTGSYNAYVTLPVEPVPIPEPVSDDPLDWLRDQVGEVCELARAA